VSKLQFNILASKGKARVGEITLNGVTLTTPCFMPVGTKGTIKGMILDMLQDPKYIGDLPAIKLILANTFHLYLRPGHELVRDAG
jgi:queuine tRNA-ribosyltransferase